MARLDKMLSIKVQQEALERLLVSAEHSPYRLNIPLRWFESPDSRNNLLLVQMPATGLFGNKSKLFSREYRVDYAYAFSSSHVFRLALCAADP